MKKKIFVVFAIALICVSLAGCNSSSPKTTGTFNIWTIHLAPDVTTRLNLDTQSFNDQRRRPLEFNFNSDMGVVTASFVFWNDPQGNGNYRAQYASGPLTFRQEGNSILLDLAPDFEFVGVMDIRIYEDWLIFNYTIENQLVHTAQYRKTA